MSVDNQLAFVDTNVLVYAFEKATSPKKLTARGLMADLLAQGRLRLSTQVLQELFVTLTAKGNQRCSNEEGLAALENLKAWPLVIIDYVAIRAAIRLAEQARLSFWDALIVTAAARSGATVLYTEDLSDGQEILGVRVSNPFGG